MSAICKKYNVPEITVRRFLEDGYNLNDAIELALEEKRECELHG